MEIELLQMLAVTTTGSHSHVGSQALHEVRHRLVIVLLWLLFPGHLQGDIQLISRLRLCLEFMVLFQHDTPYMVVRCASPVGSYLESFNEPARVRLQPVLHDARTLKNKGGVVFVQTA